MSEGAWKCSVPLNNESILVLKTPPNQAMALSSSDFPRKLQVLGHHRYPLGMKCAEEGVFEEFHEVGFCCFLQAQQGSRLKSEITLEILRNLAHEAGEWGFPDKQRCGLLIPPDLAQRNGARTESARLLHASSCWGCLFRLLGGQRLPGRLGARGFASSVLGTGLNMRGI